ncbi:MAG TPA: multiheme c-type cytochrome [Chthoniobacteraceae bacterium]
MASRLPLIALIFLAGSPLASAAEPVKFTSAPSCASSGCHGGGEGKNQSLTWLRKDFHSRADAILGNARSARMADTLKIQDATKSTRCTVCHSPLEAVAATRFAAGVTVDQGVACETCHGPAEEWLRFHTRPDVTHEQRVAAGMRELTRFDARANVCVACHLNIDEEIVRAGHPEMFFELDGQVLAQPPHWIDEGAWLGPRAWFVGQATALREMSWKLGKKPDPALLARWQALGWLLRESGAALPENGSFSAVQQAADRLAGNAARESWTKEKTLQLLRTFARLGSEFRESELEPAQLRRRAEMIVLGIDRLWAALKTNAAATSPALDTALPVLGELSRKQAAFDRTDFAATLEQIEVALERGIGGI